MKDHWLLIVMTFFLIVAVGVDIGLTVHAKRASQDNRDKLRTLETQITEMQITFEHAKIAREKQSTDIGELAKVVEQLAIIEAQQSAYLMELGKRGILPTPGKK